jgi:hypothetical protein
MGNFNAWSDVFAIHLHSVNRCSHQPPSVSRSFTPWFLLHLLICANFMTEWLDMYSRVARVLDYKQSRRRAEALV